MQNLKMILKNKKGLMMELIMLIIVGIIVVLFFVGWKYGFGLITDTLTSVETEQGVNATNISYAAEITFSQVNAGLEELQTIALMIIFGYIIGTFIMAYYSGEHPILFFVYFLLTAVLVIFSVYISNAYEGLLSNEVIGAELSEFTVVNFVMLHLPVIIIIVGFFSLVLMLGRIMSVNR